MISKAAWVGVPRTVAAEWHLGGRMKGEEVLVGGWKEAPGSERRRETSGGSRGERAGTEGSGE